MMSKTSSKKSSRIFCLLLLWSQSNLPMRASGFSTLGRARTRLTVSLAVVGNDKGGSQSSFETPIASVSATSPTSTSLRRVARVEKFARLPVWPVWMGVVIFLVSRTLGNDLAAKLEDAVGGRVCPNFFSAEDGSTSPFIMLVHHRHSFSTLDPLRWIQNRFILPEGFPAHPHRGFTTLTYFMRGGFRHRDSMGVIQDYGNSKSSWSVPNYPHSQWLFTGAGLLHEEMFNKDSQQELYQLWVNVPSQRKLDPPDVTLLGDAECPRIVTQSGASTSETVVLAGDYQGEKAKTPVMSDMAIFHVKVDADSQWSYKVPSSFETVVLYVRQGSCSIAGTEIPVHHTAYLEAIGQTLLITTPKATGVDFLLLAGEPLREPVAAQGSMVMNTASEINQAYTDYQLGRMGTPWNHELSNDEWKQHVANNPCRYNYQSPE